MYVSICMPLVSFSWVLWGESSRWGESRFALLCHRKRDISRRCRNQQRGGQSGRLTSECSETTPTWIRRYNPGQASSQHLSLLPPSSRLAPSGRRPVGHRQYLALSRRTSVHISPSSPPVCAYLPFSSTFNQEKMLPSPLLPPFLPSPRFSLTTFFLKQTRFRVRLNPHERPSLAF